MCNLYDIGSGQNSERVSWEKDVREAIAALNKLEGIRPTDLGLTVRRLDDAWDASVMRWGFQREFRHAINNARLEKAEGGMWKRAWEHRRRCLIPMSRFYEWTGEKKNKQAHAIQPAGEGWMWAAGLWEMHSEAGLSYTMLTTAANSAMSAIHDRMPLILTLSSAEAFLRGEDPPELMEPVALELRIQPCENPLKSKPAIVTPVLPGFGDLF